jgi:hypothetical protein
MSESSGMYSIDISGHNVDIIESSPGIWARDAMGRTALSSLKIMVSEDQAEDAKANTILHETLHLIADMHSLTALNKDETAICVLTNSLFMFLRHPKNRPVVNRIMGMPIGEPNPRVFNSITIFVDECCEFSETGRELSSNLWNAYREWCRKGNFQTWARNYFTQRVLATNPLLKLEIIRIGCGEEIIVKGLSLNAAGKKHLRGWQSDVGLSEEMEEGDS